MRVNPLNPSASKQVSDPSRGLDDQLLLGAHTCVVQNKSMKKSIESFGRPSAAVVAPKGQGLADQLLLSALTCVLTL